MHVTRSNVGRHKLIIVKTINIHKIQKHWGNELTKKIKQTLLQVQRTEQPRVGVTKEIGYEGVKHRKIIQYATPAQSQTHMHWRQPSQSIQWKCN